MSQGLPKFELLEFGELDAALEADQMPELLLKGYYDYNQAVQKILAGRTWILLGPKGSGKSAALEHIRLKWQDEWNRFFTGWDLAGFPVNDMTKIQMGQSAGGSRNQAAWEFVLLLRVIETLSSDQGRSTTPHFDKVVSNLRERGLLTSDWSAAVAAWSGTAVKLDLKIFSAETKAEAIPITPLEANVFLRELLETVSTESKHIVAIDGLDSFFFEQDDEWASLAGLMQATLSLNRYLVKLDLPVSIVVAARTDVFDMLPGPEINRLKSHAVHLDWHRHGIGADNHLWKLLTEKARVRAPLVNNIVGQYLSREVVIGPHRAMPEFLLDNTRLLPRDAVAMMRYLQQEYRGGGRVAEANAKRAVKRYCEEYFVGEIFDNLAGILDISKARSLSSFKDALRTAPTRQFTFDYVCQEVEGELERSEVKRLLKQMFEIGGIGVQNNGYVNFVFRRTGGEGFTTRYEFLLHDALTRAWNRRWH